MAGRGKHGVSKVTWQISNEQSWRLVLFPQSGAPPTRTELEMGVLSTAWCSSYQKDIFSSLPSFKYTHIHYVVGFPETQKWT